jgi:hypothetical protein
MYDTYRTLLYAVTERARELADLPLPQLRLWHPDVVGTGSGYEAKQVCHGLTRGEIIECILDEQFDIEFDRDIEQ